MSWMPSYQKYLAENKNLDAFVEFSLGTGPDEQARQKCLIG